MLDIQDNNGTNEVSLEMKQMASLKARVRANKDKWNRDAFIFSFSVLVIVIILISQGVGIEIVTWVATAGLLAIWLMGWKQGRDMYADYYDEELLNIKQGKETTQPGPKDETIEEKVRAAIRDMWR